ncbi:pilus assembly protein N-terminal domain-containing protein [uncultured Algimonas sp.]|uniref:pilus assembly protein N-terminal domain-containing protein n=1 Tax=uncultured Algimonas sp. TaxID=1547920 RepID=UPI00263561B7|nr:pilus assembly protein N-terminal domain-containing protein [uncultured Algimonas sp.]
MRRTTRFTGATAAFAVAALTCGLAAVPAAANEPIYRVDLNKTQMLRLPAAAGSVVIGNPEIADVTVHSPTALMVVGRGFGETNLIVLDRNDRIMVDADIQVTAITPSNGVRLFNAKARETYNCAPFCQPSPVLGDAAGHISANTPGQSSTSGPSAIFDQSDGEDTFGSTDAATRDAF